MAITEFLLARVAEDEAAAWGRIDREVAILRSDGLPNISRGDLLTMEETDAWRRPLAECAAKRAIIELAKEVAVIDDALMVESGGWLWGTGEKILVALAATYKDHKDYREAWG